MESRAKRKQIVEKIKYAHFHLCCGSATVAGIKDEGRFRYGISLCAPEDNFCRANGRWQALDRLLKQDKLAGEIDLESELTHGEHCLKALRTTIDELDRKTRKSRKGYTWFTYASDDEIIFRSRRQNRQRRKLCQQG